MNLKKYLSLTVIALTVVSCNDNEDKSVELYLTREFPLADTLKAVSNEEANVVLLFGQSNATGCSHVQSLSENNPELFATYKAGFNNTFINFVCENFSNASMQFTNTTLGQAASNAHFGPEVGIAEKLNNSSKRTFIIKYSYGGTTLHNQWLNGNGNRGGLYKCSLDFSKVSMDYLINKGYKLNILGICWMQGENDAVQGVEGSYYSNTKKLVEYYRKDLEDYQKNIRFIDAKISDVWKEYKVVNEAKEKFASEADNNYLIDTISMGLTTKKEPKDSPDIAHYDSMSMVELGRAFGENLLK